MVKDNKKKNNKKGMSFATGAVSAIAGATLIAGAAVALSNKKTRKKIMNTVNAIKEKAFNVADQIQEGIESSKEKPQEKTASEKKEAEEQSI